MELKEVEDMLDSCRKAENLGKALGYLYRVVEMIVEYLKEKEGGDMNGNRDI